MRKKKDDVGTAGDAPGIGRPRLTPIDIQQKEFRLAFRGYNERDVDEFLDRVTEELAVYVEENRRLSAQGGRDPEPDVPGTSEEVDRIVADARARAEEIVLEAEVRAAAIAAGDGDTRAIVAPYLNRERDFLQELGKLVQGHAQAIKGMVEAARAQASRADTAEPSAEPLRVPEAAGDPPDLEGEGEAEAEAGPIDEIRVQAPGPDDEVPVSAEADPEHQRSLRELFWGED